MSYYWIIDLLVNSFIEFLEKGKDKYHNGGGKEKAVKYYV